MTLPWQKYLTPTKYSQIGAVALVVTALIVFIPSIKTLGPIPLFRLIATTLIILSIIVTIQERQIWTLVIVTLLLFGSHYMQGTEIAETGAVSYLTRAMSRLMGLITLLGAAGFGIFYKQRFNDEVESTFNRLLRGVPGQKSNKIIHPPVLVCREKLRRPVYLEGMDRYLHTLLIGSTGTGKTSAVLAPMVWQDLQNMHKGEPLGITVVAPDHEFVYQVRDWCEQLSIPCTIVDLDDPNTCRFNPLEGDPTIVSEIMRTVLRSTFGDQDAFFANAQELHAKNTMLLLKRLRGDDITLLDVYKALMDIEDVQNQVDRYEELYGEDVITTYFKKEAFGRNKDKLHQFAMGLRMQISDLLTNENIYNVLVGRSEINLDRHMEEGGVLLFNTALGKMGHMSRVFGQFLIMHTQNAVFRRPGNEFTRIPHYLYIDELPVYFNPELQNLLNMGRKYRCGCVFTIQGPAQLENMNQGLAIRRIITNGCRNKIVIGLEDSQDAKLVSEMFGEIEEVEIRKTRKRFEVMASTIAETQKLQPRFTYTEVLELAPWHGLVKLVKNGRNQTPIEGAFEEPWVFQARVNKELNKIPRHQLLAE